MDPQTALVVFVNFFYFGNGLVVFDFVDGHDVADESFLSCAIVSLDAELDDLLVAHGGVVAGYDFGVGEGWFVVFETVVI